MALRQIIAAPHPIVSSPARAVEESEFGSTLFQLTADMAETMYATYGVGLAAPQVADPRRVIILDPTSDGRNLYRMVNPMIVAFSDDKVISVERCLSVPGIPVKVERYVEVTVRWQDPMTGESQEATFVDFPATVVQHEIDHLDGIVLLDHVSSLKRRRYLKALRNGQRIRQ